MKKTFLRLAALALLLTLAYNSEGQANRRSVARSAMPTLARNIKVYTFNGPSSRKALEKDCADSVLLGCVSFKTPKTWTVGTQTWSDVVVATCCQKDKFDDGHRQNPGYGDLFSWNMIVDVHKEKLCPAADGWRVPTWSDFQTLHKSLGGTGDGDEYDEPHIALRDEYLTRWGATYGGFCEADGTLRLQGEAAFYWSQTFGGLGFAISLEIRQSGHLSPMVYVDFTYGYMIRCVK